jgi:hypothetical protein
MVCGDLKTVQDCEHNVYLVGFRQNVVPKRCLHDKIYAHYTLHDLFESNLYYHVPPRCQVPKIITLLFSQILYHPHLSGASHTSLHVQCGMYSSPCWQVV